MNRNCTKNTKLAVLVSLSLAVSLPSSLVHASTGQVTRIGEADRYETAAKVATTNWSTAKDVVLVCGEGYADAVSASVLAKQLNSPILLTSSNTLNSSTRDALYNLKPENIYIVGGKASVSKAVRDALKAFNYNLIELSGKDRYETNIAVANQLVKLGVSADNVMLVSGEGFSDALSVAPIAAAKGQILLLGTNNSTSMKPIINFVKANNSKVTVVGTSYAINDNIYNSLGAIKRVNGGANRFETNLNVLNEFAGDLKTDKLFVANSSGDGYADALVASSLAGKSAAPLVLLDAEGSEDTDKAISYIKSKSSTSTDFNAIGGSSVISDNLVSRINSTVSPTTPVTVDSATVKSVSTIGLNQIKVEFNTEVDEDSAEFVSNYQIDGSNLGTASSSATLQDDKRTVLITLSKPYEQYKSVDFVVRNAISDKNRSNTLPRYERSISFSDINPPTLESVSVLGGNKLIVKFSEPIRINSSILYLMKINRQSITNYGLNSSMTVFREKSDDWADKVELYFNSPLPTGTNTFTVPDGDSGLRFDNAAKFPIRSTTSNFTVVEASGTPQVKSVTSDDYDTMYITYDRAMDRQTALEDSNYKINNSSVMVSSSDISFDDGSNDTVVKIKGLSYTFNQGENTVTVGDNIKDTFGNEINETTFKLNIGNDTVKPQITNATIKDSETIRIKFNKEVSNGAATTKSNYKIVDSDGTDISYKIDKVNSVTDSDGNQKRTFDVKFNEKDALRGSKYTLTIRNISDTTSKGNIMNTYVTEVSGLDDQSPIVKSIVKGANDDKSVIIFFNKSMDESSLINSANYFFIDGNGDTQKLPGSAILTPSSDGKSVAIDFPSSYKVSTGTSERYITKMGVSNVKDKDGNLLASIAYTGEISTNYSDGPSLVDDTANLTYDGNDIKVRFSLTAHLDILNSSDFRVNGQKPDSASMEGNDIILVFKAGMNNNDKIDSIKSAGTSTTLSISSATSVDTAGRKLKSGSDIVYLPPRTELDDCYSRSGVSSGTNSTVVIVFDQSIDDDIESSYDDDFLFTNETTGEELKVLGVSVSGRNITYKFAYGSIKNGDKISVHASSNSSTINIRGTEHGSGDYGIYSPSKDDLKGITVTTR